MATLHTIGQNTKYQTYINLLEDNAITFRKISTSPSTKTYATFENANKAFLHLYGDKDICYCVVELDESNSEIQNILVALFLLQLDMLELSTAFILIFML